MARITINEERCKGCSLCVRACPKNILKLAGARLNAKGYHPVEITDEDECTSCASCARTCPDIAIRVERD